jgi:type IV secretory pathway VirB10-like protein
MDAGLPIFLAAAKGPGLEIVFWAVMGVIWVLTQIASAKKRQRRKADREAHPAPFEVHRSEKESPSPSATELSDIFKRLGADIPATPPPKPTAKRTVPPPPPSRTTGYAAARKAGTYNAVRKTPSAPVRPEIARRLAQVKREAAEAARQATLALRTQQPDGPYAEKEPVEACSLATTSRSAGTILPRLYAMDLRLSPFPSIPMPSANRTHHTCDPLPIQLRTRRDLRNAIVAQTFLSPAKSVSL